MELNALRKKLANVTNAQAKQTLEKEMVSADSKFLANQKIKEGLRLYNGEKYIEAAAMFSQAIELNKNSSRAYFGRGTANDEQGNYMQAIADYNKAIDINPNYADAYYNRGNTYYSQGNYPQAIDDYNRNIALNPSNAEAYNNRGNSYLKQGLYPQAIASVTSD